MPQQPPNLVYGLDDKPSIWISILLALQHISIIAIGLVFPVLVVRATGGTSEQAEQMVAMCMIAAGIGVFVQALKKGPAGSGYLCPQVCGPSFMAASILAVKTGGLSMLFGMTVLAGLFEAFLSRFIQKVRFLFPTEVTGLIVAMVGISVIKIAVKNFFGLDSLHADPQTKDVIAAVSTLMLMVGLNVWSKGKAKLFCVLIGMIFGYGFAFALGIIGPAEIATISNAKIFSFPLKHHPGWSFSFYMIIPALVATLCSTIKSVGDLTTCQKINDVNWKRPAMKNISKGILADSIGAMSAGVLGGMGQSTSSSNIGLSIATAATSRVLAFFIAGILCFLALFPKVAYVFAIMPPPVVGATLFFALSFMVVVGIQIITSRMLDTRKSFVVGISMIFGLSVDMMPGIYSNMHDWIQPVFSSSLSTATVMALVLNLVFRIGIKSKAALEFLPTDNFSSEIPKFIEKQGTRWGMRKEVAKKAESAITEIFQALSLFGHLDKPVQLDATFVEESFDVSIVYSGDPIAIPKKPPTETEILEDVRAGGRLALVLADFYTDHIKIHQKDEETVISLHWEH